MRDANDTYHVRYAARDGQDKYSRVFLWDMRFAAGETKTLQVGYILPMSFTAHTTRKTDDSGACSGPPQHEKPWHARIEACILLSFVYVTETGQSWAGPIEKATFRLRSTVFEHDLQRVPEYVGVDPADPSIGLESANAGTASIDLGPMADLGFVPGMKLASVLRRVSPEGWEPASFTEVPADKFKPLRPSDGIVWRFADYRPGPPLTFRYYLVGFPESAADCSPWVRQVLGEKPDKADLLELREIVAAFFGIAPKTDSVKRFVEQQVWYDPSRPMDESQLSRPCQAVLTQLRTLAAAK